MNYIDRTILNANLTTELIESCDWDEDEAKQLLDKSFEIIEEMSSFSNSKRVHDLRGIFRQALMQYASPDQIDIIEKLFSNWLLQEEENEKLGEV